MKQLVRGGYGFGLEEASQSPRNAYGPAFQTALHLLSRQLFIRLALCLAVLLLALSVAQARHIQSLPTNQLLLSSPAGSADQTNNASGSSNDGSASTDNTGGGSNQNSSSTTITVNGKTVNVPGNSAYNQTTVEGNTKTSINATNSQSSNGGSNHASSSVNVQVNGN